MPRLITLSNSLSSNTWRRTLPLANPTAMFRPFNDIGLLRLRLQGMLTRLDFLAERPISSISRSSVLRSSALRGRRGSSLGVLCTALPRCQPRNKCRLTPPSSGRPKGRFAPFAPPLMSNVRPRQCTCLATSLQASCSESQRAPEPMSCPVRSVPRTRTATGCSSDARVARALPGQHCSGSAPTGALWRHGGTVTHGSPPNSTAAPLEAAGAPPLRQRTCLSAEAESSPRARPSR